MANKRIHNPKTGKYYKLRERTTSEGKKGQIMGAYKLRKKASNYIKRTAGDVIRKLSNQ